MAAGPQGEVERKTDNWGSRFGFIMAAVGSSVGLGNFWRFPYTAGENGGGAFIIVYLICVLVIGLPILLGEYAMGRKSGRSAIEGIQSLAREEGKSDLWGIAGWIGVFTSFFILTFYMVISAWIMSFVFQAVSSGGFAGWDADKSGANFGATIGNIPLMLTLTLTFITANVLVIGRGVHSGIERAATILMPMFFVMLLGVVVFAIATGDVGAAAKFLFEPKLEDVSFKTFLEALGQAFFSIGVGVGLMLTYGAYISRDTDLPRSSMIVAGSDTFVAIIAGLAIFPFVFAVDGLDPSAGPGLFFVAMPVAFGEVPGGAIIATVFFALALFAAFTSSISLMEVSVSWLEERHGVTRMGASIGIGVGLFLIGAANIFSTEYLDFLDVITGNLLLPLGGLLIAVFGGWVLSERALAAEFGDETITKYWRLSMRWFVPPFVLVILIFGFLDKIQDTYGVPLPGFLTGMLGPNA